MDLVTENQLKTALDDYIAEEELSEDGEAAADSPPAMIICLYIVQEFERNGVEEFEDEEFEERFQQIYIERILERLQNKGLIEAEFSPDGEVLWSIAKEPPGD